MTHPTRTIIVPTLADAVADISDAEMTPAEHARLGWSWGSYRDGICLTLVCDMAPADLAEFRAQAEKDGAEVVDLRVIN
jgi:hypothetical protein